MSSNSMSSIFPGQRYAALEVSLLYDLPERSPFFVVPNGCIESFVRADVKLRLKAV